MSSLRKGKSLFAILVASTLGFAEKIEAVVKKIQDPEGEGGTRLSSLWTWCNMIVTISCPDHVTPGPPGHTDSWVSEPSSVAQ